MKDSLGVRAPRGRRVVVGLALGALVAGFTLGVAAPAGAATTIGEAATNEHCSASTNGGSFNVVQDSGGNASYTVPGFGFLTSWSVADLNRPGIYAGTVAPATVVFSDTVQFEVWRPNGSGDFTLIFISSPQTFTENGSIHTFTLSPFVAVQTGDKIGLLVTGNTSTTGDAGCIQSVNSGTVDAFFATPSLGASLNTEMVTGLQFSDWQVNVAANFLPFAGPLVPIPPGTPDPHPQPGPDVEAPVQTPVAPPVHPAAAVAVAVSPRLTG